MELIDGSETSAIINQTPGNYPKGNLLYSVQGESLKSRIFLGSKNIEGGRHLRSPSPPGYAYAYHLRIVFPNDILPCHFY